jgi:hypothetical protein
LKNYENYKEIFIDEYFIDLLVEELKNCVSKSAEERTKVENDIIELILYLIRNSLSFTSYMENHENREVLVKLFRLYLKPVGVFNAVIFLC